MTLSRNHLGPYESRPTRRAALLGGAAATLAFSGGLRAADLSSGETGRVARVNNGSNLTLESGLRVKLASLHTPRASEPWAEASKQGLMGLVQDRQVRLSYGDDPRDRYDRALAQVHTLRPDGQADLWIQAEMVRLGLARVMTWPGDRVDAGALLELEAEARSRGRGLWTDASYTIRRPDPDPLAQYVDSFQIVEGIITQTAEVRGRTYLNFGADYRTDFTIAVARKNKRQFKSVDLLGLEGARVRVRGWIELFNGPMIWISHPERLEILS